MPKKFNRMLNAPIISENSEKFHRMLKCSKNSENFKQPTRMVKTMGKITKMSQKICRKKTRSPLWTTKFQKSFHNSFTSSRKCQCLKTSTKKRSKFSWIPKISSRQLIGNTKESLPELGKHQNLTKSGLKTRQIFPESQNPISLFSVLQKFN